jgi:flagellar biosynthetic protein FliQ
MIILSQFRLTDSIVVEILTQAFTNILQMIGPILLVAIVIGLIISILQATTQIQEQTLTFAPKLFGIFLMIVLMAPFMFNLSISFLEQIFEYVRQIS